MTIRFGFAVLMVAATLTLSAVPNPSILVSGDWLANHLQDESLVILHVGSPKDYDAGHIPGARLVTLGDISITDKHGLRLELPPVSDLEAAFERLGVTDWARIIVYAGTESVQSATRVWFTLDYLGLGDRAALLDGGLALWQMEGRALSTEAAPRADAGKFTAHPDPQLVVSADWVGVHLNDRNVQLLDARLPEFYSGANAGSMPRAGHIPGARNVPFKNVFAENGKLEPPQSLRAFLNADAQEPALTVSYCHIGQQATVLYFVARYLGLNARLYDGSFQEWSGRSGLPVEPAVVDEAISSGIDSIFAPLADGNSPGIAVLVRQHGRTVSQHGYGIRDLRTSAKIDAQTDFRLASFTKQFTAMATMLLVHDGKLRYDQKLTDLFPDFPAYGRAITVRHLLTHTSGLPDYEDLMEAAEKAKGPTWSATHQIQDREVLDLLKRESAGKFAPGTSWSYSNSAYVLLGLIVAKVSGEPFGSFLHNRIFEPLHMNDTLLYVNGENTAPNRAYGHTKRPDGFVETDQSSTSATLGDGGVYSNLVDLAKWDEALEKHVLLSREEMSAALTAVKLADGSQAKWPLAPGDDNLAPGKPVSYGFGWFLDPYDAHPRMWHTGSTTGFRTVIERFTAEQLTIVILCNRTDLDAGKLALQVADLFVGRK
jgi:CubicO group peptidase (beta-lactamase class C family)